MSIETRIQAINDHLIDDYKVLRLAGADLTGVNKNIVNLKMSWKERLLYFMNNGTQDIWNNWNKVSGTGTTLSLNNTEEAPMSLTYKGNTSQNGTPTPSSPIPVQVVSGDNSIEVVGKNYFNINDTIQVATVDYTIIDTTLTLPSSPGNSGRVVFNKKYTGGKYTLSFSRVQGGLVRVLLRVTQNETIVSTLTINGFTYNGTYAGYYADISSNKNSITIDFPTGYDIQLGFVAINFSIKDIQLEKGNKATTYEPYKGASYPITLPEGMFLGWIPNTTYQDKIDKSTGKNILQFNRDTTTGGDYNATTQTYTSTTRAGTSMWYFKTLATVKDYTLFTNAIDKAEYKYCFDDTDVSTGADIASITYSNGANISSGKQVISNNSNRKYLYISFRLGYQETGTGTISQPMLQEGNITTPVYEPYGTNWYLKKEIGKVVLNGSETWSFQSQYPRIVANYTNLNINPVTYQTQALSNYFVPVNTENSVGFGFGGSTLALRIDNSFTTLADHTSWLASHNTDIYFVNATPTYETITDTTLIGQLEALKKSYEGQTNISQVNNDLPFELSVTALEVMS